MCHSEVAEFMMCHSEVMEFMMCHREVMEFMMCQSEVTEFMMCHSEVIEFIMTCEPLLGSLCMWNTMLKLPSKIAPWLYLASHSPIGR